MPKLINADTLKRAVHNEWDDCLVWDESGSVTAEEMERIIDSQSAVDAVEVVRCKNCKFAHMTYDGECKYCDVWEEEGEMYLDGDFYCAFGKREEDESND